MQSFSTLDEWLAWFETLHPKKIDMSLGRIRSVLESLDLAEPPYRAVTVGGTNGKGSCVAYLENIYRAADYRVGAFTSPHLWRFNERICVNGRRATDQELIELFEALECARGPVTLSYFESSAVAAFLHFARQEVDVAVLEVGMGGRLDAVNVYDADVALIASVGLDHEDWLGPDRERIGYEKAGIMRCGRPVIVADPDPPRSVRDAVTATGARGHFIDHDFSCEAIASGLLYRDADGRTLQLPAPRFGGSEQFINAAACVKVVDCLQDDLPVDDRAIATGVAATFLAGRLDRRMLAGVEWIFDVAHNPAASHRFADYVESLPVLSTTTAVFGAMQDKDLRGVLEPWIRAVDRWHVAPVDSERTASGPQIEQWLERLGAERIAVHSDVESACAAARAGARPGERVLVFGSFYTVGPAMASLGLYCEPSPGA
jgi:dihydrofolate synthase/folylpolyglutamate synthase